jgi:hypothetical protein
MIETHGRRMSVKERAKACVCSWAQRSESLLPAPVTGAQHGARHDTRASTSTEYWHDGNSMQYAKDMQFSHNVLSDARH